MAVTRIIPVQVTDTPGDNGDSETLKKPINLSGNLKLIEEFEKAYFPVHVYSLAILCLCMVLSFLECVLISRHEVESHHKLIYFISIIIILKFYDIIV